jgi:xanthine dehydrogenase accessory factor
MILVRVEETQGSVPREAGAWMLVTAQDIEGTIGGGQLEFHAIDLARDMIRRGEHAQQISLALGPAMGQCCGGRVVLSFTKLDADTHSAFQQQILDQAEQQPDILIFGAGHTGRALAIVLAHLPFNTSLIDDRPEATAGMPDAISTSHLPDPITAILQAPAGAAFIILTHSHALDYRLTEAALKRGDAAYVGMIGSATKRAQFIASFLRSGGVQSQLERFVCPIGGKAITDKRPQVIAVLTATELVTTLLR